MRLLLDTHAVLWWWNDDDRLGVDARAMIAGAPTSVSAVSALEITTKYRLGKLPQAANIIGRFWTLLQDDKFDAIPIEPKHAFRAGQYQLKHGDPFDRLLAAQAELEGYVLMTKDRAFRDFPCATRW